LLEFRGRCRWCTYKVRAGFVPGLTVLDTWPQ
jgi:hypothetical protein